MKSIPILPPATQPWPEKISRRHTPEPADKVNGFRLYRACLRWEFGFSCAFCLIHERDINFSGVEGWGLIEVEHFVTQSSSPSQQNVYANCFLICGRCNRTRGIGANIHSSGWALLNPCEDTWSDHFVAAGSQILPRHQADADAAYTLRAYRLNEAGKVAMREARREKVEEARRFLTDTADFLPALFALARSGQSKALLAAKALTRMRWQATKDLVRLMAIPRDHNNSCRCGHNGHHSLPKVLEDQTFDLVDLLPKRARTEAPLSTEE